MNDPKKPNPRFAAFLANQTRSAAATSLLLKKSDTSGMVLTGMLDAIRRMPAKRSPGSVYVTLFADQCKIFDTSSFVCVPGKITIKQDANNSEERVLQDLQNVVVGGFNFDPAIENSIGKIVKCYGFHRNAGGYCVCKEIKVVDKNNIDAALRLPVQLPELTAIEDQKYKGTILQFRANNQEHMDWKCESGNACKINTTGATACFSADEELVFKGSCEAMTFYPHKTKPKLDLIELYWPALVCKKFGITIVRVWEKLAPLLLASMRGFVKANIDVVKSSGMALNDKDVACTDCKYSSAFAVYSNHVEVDLKYIVTTAGEEVSGTQVFEYFDEEYMLEFEDAAENPLNASSSVVKNLNEFSGNLKKLLDLGSEDCKFYKISSGDTDQIYAVLSKPLSKKRKK